MQQLFRSPLGTTNGCATNEAAACSCSTPTGEAPKRGMYKEPMITVMGGYEQQPPLRRGMYREPAITLMGGYDKQPSKQSDGHYADPLVSVIDVAKTPSTRDLFGESLRPPPVNVGHELPRKAASSCDSPMGQAGTATLLGNF